VQRAEKVIISTAVTGSVNVPSQSDYLPLSAEQVVQASLEAAAAGSAIIHLHARHPDGRPAFEASIFEEIIPAILSEVDVVINMSTGGSSQMTIEERLAGAVRFSPELASLNMGSMNFVYSGIADKVTEWKHDWEKPYVLGTYSHPFINSFATIEHVLRSLGEERGTRFEFECYDIGHLYSLAYFAEKGLAKPPFMIQGVFGTAFGITLGLVMLHYRNAIMRAMSVGLNMELFPKELYHLSEIPARIAAGDVFMVAALSILICTLAGLLPAWRAARLDPAQALRYE